MSGAVQLAPHNPAFAKIAGKEAARWHKACGTAMTGFHHIGSTAVRGLIAKPVLDLMPIFASLEELDALRERICALGVVWLGAYGLPGRRYCKRQDSDPVQHIHCYAEGHDGIARHLAFRDYLRNKPDAAEDYARLKHACAARHSHNRKAYANCKSDWIRATETDALVWQRQREHDEHFF